MRSSIFSFLWLASEKLVRIFTGVFVGLWLARYLGPEQYGVYMYALAWVGLFNALAWFGVGENVIRNLVKHPDSEHELLGSAFMIRLIGSLAAGVLALLSLLLLRAPDPTLTLLVLFCALAIPFAETPAGIFLYFQSRLQIAKPVLLQNIVRIAAAAVRIAFITGKLSLPWFGVAVLLESVGIFLVLFGYYLAIGGRCRDWVYDWSAIRNMVWQGAPIALAALVASLSARTDQLMLGWYTGYTQVGIYGAALRLSEIWWTFAPILMNSLSPKYIFNIHGDGELRENIAKIMAILALTSLLPVLAILALGQYAIPLLLGKQYVAALPVLHVHIFMAVLVFFDAPTAQYLLARDRQSQLVWRSAFLLTLNLLLNYLLVPRLGALGAAIATLLSYIGTLLLFYRLAPSFRDLATLQNRALGLMWQLLRRRGRFA
ncbi:flippase [Duganella sp. FT3S]|uniref:Flippase n=1 Tax=Rugamonas fusca TaxID=2758568 RepID=A0A7W2EKI8_9BURK|nr:flippase [Rugamonas fusca]MBA5607588.1 flippase [Rugamonas fusca]